MKIEKIRTYGWESALMGMRNPKDSWDKSDSAFGIADVEYTDVDYDIAYLWAKNELSYDDDDIDKKFYNRAKDYVVEFPVEKVETNYKNMILSDLANVYRVDDSKFVSALYSLMFSKYSYQAGFICNLILTGKLANIKLAKKLFILSVKRR